MRRWLRVVTTEHRHVGIWPDDKRLLAHPGLMDDSPEATRWDAATLVESLEAQGRVQESEIGAEAQALGLLAVREKVEPSLNPLRNRILTETLHVFAAPSATVHFEFAGKPFGGEIPWPGADTSRGS